MFSVYILKSNIENDNNRYIGITNNIKKRLQRHLRNSKVLDYHSSRWIKKVINNNGKIEIETLLTNLTQEEAFNKEIEYIKLYKELGYNLTNISDGGQGFIAGEKNPKYKHGLVNTNEYQIWCNIKRWCFNKNDINYKEIGQKGISMYFSWIDDSKEFIEYIKSLKNYGKKDFILSRIDWSRNYEPGNLIWCSKNERQAKQKIQKNNISGYIGVSYKEKLKKWTAQIEIKRKNIYIGIYSTKEQAVEARNKYIIDNQLVGYKIQNIY